MLIPIWLFLLWLFFLGGIIGSFLGVVSYRLHTNHSLGGSSHCESCKHDLAWYELVPIVSYLALRGRCHACSSLIPRRHFLIELLTASLFAFVGFFISDLVALGFSLVIVSVLVVIFAYDIRHLIIPDELIYTLLVLAVAVFLCEHSHSFVWSDSISPLLGAGLAAGFYGLLWYLSGGRAMGFGDVKLALPLGFMLGPGGAMSMLVFSFWIGALVSLVVMFWPPLVKLLSRLLSKVGRGYSNLSVEKTGKYLTMKSEVPFAPFLSAAFLLVYVTQIDVLSLTNYVLNWFFNF